MMLARSVSIFKISHPSACFNNFTRARQLFHFPVSIIHKRYVMNTTQSGITDEQRKEFKAVRDWLTKFSYYGDIPADSYEKTASRRCFPFRILFFPSLFT